MNNMSIMDKINKGLKKLDYINHWTANCDSKVSFLLAIFGVFMTILFSTKCFQSILEIFNWDKIKGIDWYSLFYVLYIVVAICFIVSIFTSLYFIYQTLRARLKPSEYQDGSLVTNSKIFFGGISSSPYNQFEDATNNETEEEYLKDINSQIYINSKITNLKFNYYNKSIKSIAITFITFMILMIFK